MTTMFELTDTTSLKVVKVTPRKEIHGDDGEGQEPGDQQHAGNFGQPEGDEAQATGTDDAAAFEAGVAASMAEAGLKPKAEPRGRRPSLGVVR